MDMENRNYHLRLQEYCDCYMESDPQKELAAISGVEPTTNPAGEVDERALKFLGLSILYGIKESARKLDYVKTYGRGVELNVEAAGRYKFTAPPRDVGDKIFDVMRSITHLESENASEPLSLGLRDSRMELGVRFESTEGKQTLSISFPEN